MASLFSDMDDHEEVTVIPKEKRTKIRFADINMEYQFVTPYNRRKNMCNDMEMIRFSLGAKSWGSTVVQCHEEAGECTLILMGQLEYHIGHGGEKVYTLKEGDSIYLPPNTPHRVYNPGGEAAEAVAVISPAYY